MCHEAASIDGLPLMVTRRFDWVALPKVGENAKAVFRHRKCDASSSVDLSAQSLASIRH